MKLNGKVVLITGAARRIGRATALRLAESGCRIALHYHRSTDEAEKTAADCRARGTQCATFSADLADSEQAARLPERVADEFGALDALINNASEFVPMALEDFNLAAWERALRVNLTAPMVLAHAARLWLVAAGGRIVNLCDAFSDRPLPNYLAYYAAKGGLETLTRALARAFAPQVNVIGIAPGVAAWPKDFDPHLQAKITARIPLQRAGAPEDIAAAIHFALADGDYITGTILRVDGGRSVAT